MKIESRKPPEKFYNGWYPIREQCSFPDHKPTPRAGMKSVKGLQFRNYRMLCEICDHPDNQLPPVNKTSYCGHFNSEPNSVAPNCEKKHTTSANLSDNVEYVKVKPCHSSVDAHWRYHDPHLCQTSNAMPAECKVHDSNWFKHQVECDNKYKLHREMYKKLDTVKKDCKIKNIVVMPKKLCQQQARSSGSKIVQPLLQQQQQTPQKVVVNPEVSTVIEQRAGV